MNQRPVSFILLSGIAFALSLTSQVCAEETPQGDRLIIAEAGELPILITAPHGGTKPVPGVKAREDRPGERVNLRRDEMTNRLAILTAKELKRRVGKRPFLVVAEFSRKAIDANRPEETAFQQPAARPYYQAYHQEIARFAETIRRQWGQGLMLDLHAQWLRPDVIMRGTRDGQTIRGLLDRRDWEGLLGPDGILGSLAAQGIPIYPPAGTSEGQWTHVGSVSIVRYSGDGIDALQLEIGSHLCDSEEDVRKLAGQLAIAIERHLQSEQQLSSARSSDETSLTALVENEKGEKPEAASDAQGAPLNGAEQAFVDLLTGSDLVGRFSIDGSEDDNPRMEQYTISRVMKVADDNWIVQARIKYGNVDLTVPVPVKVNWAGDTPVISLTDLKIPGLGEGFTTRVLFYEDRYAGSWYHGEVGGHMWGRIEKAEPPENDAEKTP